MRKLGPIRKVGCCLLKARCEKWGEGGAIHLWPNTKKGGGGGGGGEEPYMKWPSPTYIRPCICCSRENAVLNFNVVSVYSTDDSCTLLLCYFNELHLFTLSST